MWSVCGWTPGSIPGSTRPGAPSRSFNPSWRSPTAGPPGADPAWAVPALVPVAISDFVFTSIAEETGLVGTLGLLAMIGFFVARGMRAAMRAPDNFRRILAAGLSAYIGAQSILIIGGNIRLLPLTGVTLPFVSYGGSSLLTSCWRCCILLFISSQPEDEPAPLAFAAALSDPDRLDRPGTVCPGRYECLVGHLARSRLVDPHR